MFLGTPEHAMVVLGRLLEAAKQPGSGFQVCAVVSPTVRPPKARSTEPHFQHPVERFARQSGLANEQIIYSNTGGEASFVSRVRALAPDLCVCAAFSPPLPQRFLDIPPLGTVTVHSSLLPAFCGPEPILRALEAGVQETGVSLAYNSPNQPDAAPRGPVLQQHKVAVNEDSNLSELERRLMVLGADLLVRSLPDLLAGSAPAHAVPQDEAAASAAPAVAIGEINIDFGLSAAEAHRKVCAYRDSRHGGARARFTVVKTGCGNRQGAAASAPAVRPGGPPPLLTLWPQRTRVVGIDEAAVLRLTSYDGRGKAALCVGGRMLVPCGDGQYLEFLQVALMLSGVMQQHPVHELGTHLGLGPERVLFPFDTGGLTMAERPSMPPRMPSIEPPPPAAQLSQQLPRERRTSREYDAPEEPYAAPTWHVRQDAGADRRNNGFGAPRSAQGQQQRRTGESARWPVRSQDQEDQRQQEHQQQRGPQRSRDERQQRPQRATSRSQRYRRSDP